MSAGHVPPRAPKGWRWGLGSADLEGDRVVALSLNGLPVWARDVSRGGVLERDHVPDFNDPATLGCLLALVREAWGDPNASCGVIGLSRKGTYVWSVCGEDEPICMEATEAEALVAALEAAP